MRFFPAILLLASPLSAATVNFEWDAPSPGSGVTEHRLVEIIAADSTRLVATVSGDTVIASGAFAPGEHTVYVVAQTVPGVVSDPSNLVTFTVPPNPVGLRIKIALQSSADGQAWTTVLTHEEPEESRKFYRLAFLP